MSLLSVIATAGGALLGVPPGVTAAAGAVVSSGSGSNLLNVLTGHATSAQIHRAQEIQALYNAAVAGDADALAKLYAFADDSDDNQAQTLPSGASFTDWSHTRDTRMWAAKAIQALAAGDTHWQARADDAVSAWSSEVGKLTSNLRHDAASFVQRVGTGASATAADTLDPGHTQTQLFQGALLVGAAVLVVWLVARRKG